MGSAKTDGQGDFEQISPHEKKMQLYADEDIKNEAVEYLRQQKVNIVSVREKGNQGNRIHSMCLKRMLRSA